ncbi:SusC/RagA family TonB-linked outer membrane protein [Pedobacter sp. BS3]|uniref:SusC/RagA family TonB-linked outer membrane protein n=1 Tax=Pedobacter sp. BS3 TaxID=2567937 RepID=UPI0011ED2FF8|nr:SusC/RagA family TonB-linked outer membrane protein [Pedobacter sp. BS3]TZF83841.1 SusC/RagA family TonB-linked outer membrane protein [Pedobacter sp. BS3]
MTTNLRYRLQRIRMIFILFPLFVTQLLKAQDAHEKTINDSCLSVVTVCDYKLSPDYHANSIAGFLQGRVAGLKVTPYSGQPGTATTLDIRGITTISGSNYPLIVIDGQVLNATPGHTIAGDNSRPTDVLGGISLEDIETIEVLKDAATTGIYGAMAGNGIIKITTKQDKKQGKLTYFNRVDMAGLPRQQSVLNAGDYMRFINEGRQNSGQSPLYTDEQINTLSANSINWQDRVFKNSFSQMHYLSLSGSNDKSNYFVSGNYNDQNAIASQSDYLTGGLRINADHTFGSKLKVGLRSYYSGTRHNYAGNTTEAAFGETNFAPLFALINSPLENNPAFSDSALTFYLNKNDAKLDILLGNINASYHFNEKWTYNFLAGIDRYHAKNELVRTTSGDEVAVHDGNKNTSYTIFNELNYRETRQAHTFDVSAIYAWQKWKNETVNGTSLFDYEGSRSYSSYNAGLHSIKARVGYDYDKRYALTLTGTYEGMSRYAPDSRWKLFPSAGFNWTISNEKNFNWQVISLLRLRTGYGVAGIEYVRSANYVETGSLVYYPGSTVGPGYVLSDMNNANLKPSLVKNFNIGADIGLAGNAWNFSLDYYRKNVSNMLINVSAPGGISYYTNMGEIANSGLEITGNYLLCKTNWSVTIGGNIAFMRNKLNLPQGIAGAGQAYYTSYNSGLGMVVQTAQSGNTVSSFYTYKTDGIYQTAAEVAAGPEAATAQPGDIKWVDWNHDSQITDADRTVTGNPYPDFIYGLNAAVSYKKISVNLGITGSYGNELLNLNKWVTHTNNTYNNYNMSQDAYTNRWTGPGSSNLYPRATYSNLINAPINTRVPDWAVEDASFLRLQYISAGYTFAMNRNSKVKKLRVYLSATNIFTITNYSGYDPDIDTYGDSVINRGIDWGTLPRPRTVSAGLELNL